jgi:hypothetical protein
VNFAALSLPALLGLALFTGAAVVAMYLLRRTPRPQVVSSVAFWRRAIERSRPRSPFATRIPWLAMLLSLAIATLLVVELGDPRLGAGPPGTTVIVLAADRTMATRGLLGRRRLDEALSVVRGAAQASTVDGRVALLRAGARNTLLVPITPLAADVERVLAGLDTDDGSADLGAAVTLARTIVRCAGGGGRVFVVADREALALTPDRIPVTYVSVGDTAETVAITAFDARRDPLALGEYHVRGEVRSYAERRARVRVVVRDRGTLLSEQTVALAPGEARAFHARGFSSAQAELTAALEDVVLEGGRDALTVDDRAFAALAPVASTRVLLVTPGDRYLTEALGADPSVLLEVIPPTGLAARRASLRSHHVLVLDRVDPEGIDHPALFVLAPEGGRTVRVGRELNAPGVTAVASEHRVLAGLRLDQIRILRARALVPDAGDRVLLRSGRDVLAYARDVQGARSVVLGFDTAGSDFARRVAFPLFVHNVLLWLDRREREHRAHLLPGEPIRAPAGVVVLPSGGVRDVPGALFETGRAGHYRTAGRVVAVSGADLSGAIAVAPRRAHVFDVPGGRTSLALLVAVVALALLCVEWALTTRGRLR